MLRCEANLWKRAYLRKGPSPPYRRFWYRFSTQFFLAVVHIIRQLVIEMSHCSDTAKKIIEIDELIRRVGIFVRQAKAKKYRIQLQYFFELNHDRYRSSLPLVERFFS